MSQTQKTKMGGSDESNALSLSVMPFFAAIRVQTKGSVGI